MSRREEEAKANAERAVARRNAKIAEQAERITALEAKCDLLSASLRKADARVEELEGRLNASEMANTTLRDNALVAESERDALRAEVEGLRVLLGEFEAEVSKAAYAPQFEHLGPLVLTARATLPRPGAEGALRPAEWCRSCPHPPHLGICTKRNGGTAYACGCSAQTPPLARSEPKGEQR